MLKKIIKNSKQPFRDIFEAVNDGILIIDPSNCNIVDANFVAAGILGYDLKELIGMNLVKIHPDDMEKIGEIANRVIGGEGVVTDEYPCRKMDGEFVSTELSISAMELAGQKYLISMARDITERKLAEATLKNALSENEKLKESLKAEVTYLQSEIKCAHNFEEIVTKSACLKKELIKVSQVAVTDATVLITGETGTGKELIARAVHSLSKRKDRPLIKVNAACISENLVESELFGHEKGAFTGAVTAREGRFDLANGGTIFLDEIGELPMQLQAKLLRVLQEGEFERLGGSKTHKVDIRVIAATNVNLPEAVKKGKFREDLYYRLNIFPIECPPLRERKDDIEILARHFIKKYSAKICKKIENIAKDDLKKMIDYDWPGNIRELENIIERAVIISEGRTLKVANCFPNRISENKSSKVMTFDEAQYNHIINVLEITAWKISGENGAAKLLGMKPTTLESRMKKLGITRAVVLNEIS